MANWCENNLKIIGKEKELKKFCKKIDKKGFLNSFIPIPKELIGTRSPSLKQDLNLLLKYKADNWYDWNIKNWGIKWDFEIDLLEEIEEEGDEINLQFDTAWAPPLLGLKNISLKYPEMEFLLDYDEPGMRFRGLSKIKNGVVDDTCFDY